ncbi:MAG: PorV/PorQ family protein [Calditrichaeota bacterium]|nr:PorV/PorQ family protein [Calditrichota bacterium]MCB0288819.1 PorV/PorQ family protein [Calditrichota bacterium]MCB0294377.1 PorV/PorQ family protein [Calditrichota bacterium]MCB0303121.1 PorV/PorQ family protein [Calditrichota bacterium]MCB0315868.1 PorV/PorQ family protein [Calditrichota bacterium]
MKHRNLIGAIALIMLVLFLGLSPVFAGDPARIGTAAGEQLLVPVGARSLALGGSNVAYTKGLDALYWNPAGLSLMDRSAAGTFSTMQIFGDIDVNYLAIGLKAGALGSIGLSFKVFDFGDIPITTNEDIEGANGATFAPSFFTAGLTYSRRLTDVIQVGATAKLVNESVPRASASAVAFDVGIQYHDLGGIDGVSFGLAVKNIGTNMQYAGSAFLTQATDAGAGRNDYRERPTATHQLPATVELGVGYQRNIDENNSITFNTNFENQNFGNDNFKFGIEYSYSDLIALRGGYKFTDNVDSEDQLYTFTLGVGLHYDFGGTDMTFDYAFRDSQYFDGNNLFSLTIGF